MRSESRASVAISGDVTVWASELKNTIKSEMMRTTIGAAIDETRGREGSGAMSSMAIGEIVGEAMAFMTMTGDATIGIMGVAMMCDDMQNVMGATGATIAMIGGVTTLATRDQHGYQKPAGLSAGLPGVGVRVWCLYPTQNPYPSTGWRV